MELSTYRSIYTYANRHDYDAFPLANATAQCVLMDMLHYHEKSISRFLLLCGLVWCKGSLC
jgi:hypothetical protein